MKTDPRLDVSEHAIGNTFTHLNLSRMLLLDCISMAYLDSIETDKRDLLEKLLDLSLELRCADSELDGCLARRTEGVTQ